MTIRRIVPNIHSARMAESRSFYIGFLGMEVAMDMGWIVTFVALDIPAAQISVVQTEEAAQPTGMSLTVEVADVDEVYARAEAVGLEVVYPLTDEPWGVRRFHVVDPNDVAVNVRRHA